MTPSKTLFYACSFFILGIFLSSTLEANHLNQYSGLVNLILALLVLGAFLISSWGRFKELIVFVFCLLFLMGGIWWHQRAIFKTENNELKKYFNQNIVLIGVVDQEPEKREKITRLTIKIEDLKERILITQEHYPEYEIGDKLKITGKLEEPQIIEGFNYKDYLAKEGIFGLLYYPQTDLIEKNQGSFLQKSLISFKNKLEESLNKAMPRPQSAILEALLFGKEENISLEWKEKLNQSGKRHITAISGMHITIISFLILNFLLALGFWRQHAFYLSLVVIILFILMIGAPTSTIRAGIMVFLLLTAQRLGRLSFSSRTIIFAAALMLVQNPLLLKLDAGFQLSFLATLGLIYFYRIFFDFFKKVPTAFEIRNNLAVTFAAQVFTLPILIYNFGYVPLISPLPNLLILPFIPFIILLGFLFSFLGIFWVRLAQIFSWPAWLLITYILKVIDFSLKIPFSSLVLENVHWGFLVISYLVLGIILWRLQEKFTHPSF